MRKEDIRAIKTKSALKKHLVLLLKNKPLDRITVIELTKLCKINRNTFYLHFKSIDDLFFIFKKEVFSLFISPLKNFNINDLIYNHDILISLYSNLLISKETIRDLLFNIDISNSILEELISILSEELYCKYKKILSSNDSKYKINITFLLYGFFFTYKNHQTNLYSIEDRISLLLNKGIYQTYKKTLNQ